jgi:large subunit ribosomal protein L18
MLPKQQQRKRRHNRVRAKIKGTTSIPRLCVFRSNKYIYAQIIDDGKASTIYSARETCNVKGAGKLGKEIAEKALAKKISKIVFDRGGYKYHGRVKALAEGAREAGLKF